VKTIKSLILASAIMPAISSSGATNLNQHLIDRIADAIYIAEGGPNTNYPYGIKSVKTTHYRRTCELTIVHNYRLWNGRGDFIVYLGNHYCPAETDFIGHKNWINNVKWYMRKDK
jgi:hypothetical protein